MDLVAGYNCICPSAYAGRLCATPYCQANNPCRNGGTCHGAGLCRCPLGYTGSKSLSFTDLDSYLFNYVYKNSIQRKIIMIINQLHIACQFYVYSYLFFDGEI